MTLTEKYIHYLRDIRRYSSRTVDIYREAVDEYVKLSLGSDEISDEEVVASLNTSEIRRYEARQLENGLSPRTVNLHLSALSGFCRFLMKEGILRSNPVKPLPKPRTEKRLPVFYRREALDAYFEKTEYLLDSGELEFFKDNWNTSSGRALYEARLSRLILSLLYSMGIRRAELINLNIESIDFGRKIAAVRGKGDKMRNIPLIPSVCEEILLYLDAVEVICGRKRSLKEPLLVTYKGKKLYPVYVDRMVKSELADAKGISGRKSPHVLRHSLATGLMNEGADINSIKELLGHSSLAATQVYTHSSISRLKTIYKSAHPRAKNGGKHGD